MNLTNTQKLDHAKNFYELKKYEDAKNIFSDLSNSTDNKVKQIARQYLKRLESKLNDKKQILNDKQLPKIHPNHMYTSKIISTKLISKAINDQVTVGNIKLFEKIVESYPQNTIGIIVTSQIGCSINSSKRSKSPKSSASIVFTSISEMATDIPAYFLLRKDQCKNNNLIEKFEKFERIMEIFLILLIFLLLAVGYSIRSDISSIFNFLHELILQLLNVFMFGK
ncbi:hypothetical protein C2G38_2221173 [Gigaspora rosea]|uniref:Uncharacterized protein n=1 Tax=Gigaspora rosea TaxID=44941 RepID=A0A397U5F7_9GLOM|nr:hypothetical protein C2G38_2221173 [Gigaspora rosea]